MLAAAVPLLVCGALWWPVPVALDHHHVHTAFADSHVWVFDHLARRPDGDLPGAGCLAGYPIERSVRAIGWVPGLVAMALRPVLGALGAANLVQLLSLPASALAAAVFVRRTTGVDPYVAALLGAAFGLSPTLLGTLATGEISNTQAWLLPCFLLAARGAVRDGPRALPAVAAVGLAAAFTSPYYALALPIIGGLYAAASLRDPAVRTRALAMLATLGAALLPAYPYYGGGAAGGASSLFRPARALTERALTLPHPAPVAQPETLLWHSAPPPGSDVETLHVTALGLALLAVAAFGLLRRRGTRGYGLGLGLTVGGMLAALGPVLYVGGVLRGVGSVPLPLPVGLLEAVGWPTRQGGLYFRYAVVAELGLVVLAATALRHHRRARWLATLVLLLHIAEGARASGPWSARTRSAVHGRAALEVLAGTDGAVLELPLQGPTDGWFGQQALLRAVYHQRPTTALPRAIHPRQSPVHRHWTDALAASTPAGTRAHLVEAGYRLVLLPEALAPHVQPPLAMLEAALGPAASADGLLIWDLGPATARCRATAP